MTATDTERLWSEVELARFLHVSPRTLRLWRARQSGPPWIRCGERMVRYPASSVAAWLAKGQRIRVTRRKLDEHTSVEGIDREVEAAQEAIRRYLPNGDPDDQS